MSQKVVATFKIAKHALSRQLMARFFTSEMKKTYLIKSSYCFHLLILKATFVLC